MRVTIENFRGVANRTVVLPDVGMVQLAGDSEAGKTTILEAIVWAFYGSVKNVTPLVGSKDTKVTVSYKRLEIVRTKNPNSLTCNGLVEDAAQALINNTIAEEGHFTISSYVQQKLKNCFLNLTPKNQLDMLNRLSISVDIDKINSIIRGMRTSSEEGRRAVDNSISIKQEALSHILSRISEYKREKSGINITEKRYDEACEKLAYMKSVINNVVPNIEKEISRIQVTRAERQREIANVNADIEDAEKKASEIITQVETAEEWLPKTIEERDEVLSALKEAKRVSDSNKKIYALVDNHKKKLVEFDLAIAIAKDIEEGVDIEKEKEDTKGSLNRLSIELSSMLSEREYAKHVQQCPHCNGNLRVVKGEIQTASAPVEDVEAKINENMKQSDMLKQYLRKLEDASKKIAKGKEALTEKQKIEAVVATLLNGLQDEPPNIEEFIQEKKERIATMNIAITDFEYYLGERDKLEAKYAAAIDKRQVLLADYASPETQEFFAKEEVLEKQLEERRKSYNSTAITNMEELIQAYTNDCKLEKKLAVAQEEEQSTREDIATLKSKLIVLSDKIEKCDRLLAQVQNKQLSAIGHLTLNLNLSVEKYVNRFFPDCGTDIRVLSHKQNKDGSISDKVSVEIVHNGVKCSIDTFSGGAENRAIVAFQLAMSEVVNSPLLLLDEPLVGVHATLRDEIYSTIRSFASNKLIIVVEHGAPENLFDLVLEV